MYERTKYKPVAVKITSNKILTLEVMTAETSFCGEQQKSITLHFFTLMFKKWLHTQKFVQ